MSRPRKQKYKGLPPNLFFDKSTKFYKYRRIDTKKFYSMGKDKFKAISAAKQLNALLMEGQDLVAKVIGNNITLNTFIYDRFEPQILPERDLADETLKIYRNKLKTINAQLGERVIDEITVKDIADFLSQFPPTQSNRYRSLLSLLFKYIVAEGHREDNPAANTINRKIKKKRQRLKLEEFNKIYSIADQWLKNAMDIALLTAQRREEIVRMKFSDIKEGCLYVIQKKTQKHGEAAHIKISIGSSLQKVINRCRDNILSPFIIHRMPERMVKSSTRVHHTQITPDYLSKKFAKARDEAGLFGKLSIEERPTFHEIRSLSIKLYDDAGKNAQALAGHTNKKMTELYKKGHEVQWTEAIADLALR